MEGGYSLLISSDLAVIPSEARNLLFALKKT
jgi:hypothetical protein